MKTNIFIAVLSALVLVSCSGTQIQMTEYLPAQFNMRRGSTIGLTYSGELSYKVTDELIKKIRQDGYYQLAASQYAPTDYKINVIDVADNTSPSLRCLVTDSKTGAVIYKNVVSQSWGDIGKAWMDIGQEFKSKFAGTEPPESRQEILLAKKIYLLFAPHEHIYKERVKTSSDNPALENAVAACNKQDWTQARQYALSAVQNNPQDPESLYLMGLLERNESNFEDSDSYFKKALEIDPDNSKYKSAIQKNAQMRKNESYVSDQLSDQSE